MNKLLQWIDDYKKSNPTGWRKWVIGTVVVLASVVALGIWFFVESRRGAAIAGLETQRDAAQEAVRQAEANQKLAQSAAEQVHHAQIAQQARDEAAALQEQISQLQDEHERNTQIIDSIRSWDDVDRRVQ